MKEDLLLYLRVFTEAIAFIYAIIKIKELIKRRENLFWLVIVIILSVLIISLLIVDAKKIIHTQNQQTEPVPISISGSFIGHIINDMGDPETKLLTVDKSNKTGELVFKLKDTIETIYNGDYDIYTKMVDIDELGLGSVFYIDKVIVIKSVEENNKLWVFRKAAY
jgi:hypothetical protein